MMLHKFLVGVGTCLTDDGLVLLTTKPVNRNGNLRFYPTTFVHLRLEQTTSDPAPPKQAPANHVQTRSKKVGWKRAEGINLMLQENTVLTPRLLGSKKLRKTESSTTLRMGIILVGSCQPLAPCTHIITANRLRPWQVQRLRPVKVFAPQSNTQNGKSNLTISGVAFENKKPCYCLLQTLHYMGLSRIIM